MFYTLLFLLFFFFFNDTATTEIYTLSLHDALPIRRRLSHSLRNPSRDCRIGWRAGGAGGAATLGAVRSSQRARRFVACARQLSERSAVVPSSKASTPAARKVSTTRRCGQLTATTFRVRWATEATSRAKRSTSVAAPNSAT